MPLFAWLGPMEIGIVALVALALFGSRKLPELMSGVRIGCRQFKNASEALASELNDRDTDLVCEALTHDNRTAEFLRRKGEPEELKSKLILWLAQGFGAGRFPFAPGAWGSLTGMAWALLLLGPESPAVYLAGIVFSTVVAVWICSQAARIPGRHDPDSLVLGKVTAMPVAVGGCVIPWWVQHGTMPDLVALANGWPALVAAFLLFRLFDTWRPWPIRMLGRLPDGWGLVVAEVAAGIASAAALAALI